MNKYTKEQRQQLLKRIIGEQAIGDQGHLLDALKSHGVDATQATVSRDLREMGVSKIRAENGVFKYQVMEKVPGDVIRRKLKVLFENFLVEIKSTNNLLLLKTSPGNANGVASFIDRLEFPEVLGTVAGDDTILAVVDTVENREKIEVEFRQLFESIVKEQDYIEKQ